MRFLLLAFVCAGCIDTPALDPEPPPDMGVAEPELWPGYCLAENELDGVDGPDGRRTAVYQDGLLVRDEFDSDVDGDVDVISTYEYDDDERLVRLTIDQFADQVVDEIRAYEWQDERLIRETWDQDADGEVDVDITYRHDELGRRVRGEGQADEDPEPEIVLRFDWEDDLLLALYIDGFSGPADGTFERSIFYAYDEAGNLTTAIFDFDGNGTADMVVSYDYGCWM